MTSLSRVLSAALLLMCALPAWGGLTIQITRGAQGAVPIAVVPFAWSGTAPAPPQDISAIVSADLARSGRFEPLASANLIAHPTTPSQVNLQSWRVLGVNNLVIGQVQALANGQFQVEFYLYDVYQSQPQSQLLGQRFTVSAAKLRDTAHHISDLIYQQLTGERGAFDTRIAYVTVSGPLKSRQYALQVADSDGYNARTILRSSQPLMSPAWSPDGSHLAYVSFESGRPQIFSQDLATGARRVLTSFSGINGAPAWSPDGRQLAVTLSRNGNPDIYVLDLASGRVRRVTHNPAIDTEAAWSPDGRELVFTSDRGGSPQIYRIPAQGGEARRVTFEGNYNARASFSPDGTRIAMVHREQGKYRIAVLDLKTGVLQVVSDGSMDESPSFAPNGRMILYSTEYHNRRVLATVTVDGHAGQRLVSQEGDVQEPAWAPYAAR